MSVYLAMASYNWNGWYVCLGIFSSQEKANTAIEEFLETYHRHSWRKDNDYQWVHVKGLVGDKVLAYCNCFILDVLGY